MQIGRVNEMDIAASPRTLQRTNLFVNKVRQSEADPHYYGSMVIEGRLFWVKAWIKEAPNGNVLVLSLKPREGKGTTEYAVLSMGDDRNV